MTPTTTLVKTSLKPYPSAFSKIQLLSELWRVLSCESPPVFLHFPLEEKGPWGPFYELWRVLAKRRHLLQILLKALLSFYKDGVVIQPFCILVFRLLLDQIEKSSTCLLET